MTDLIRLVAGEVPPDERESLERHLQQCDDCRRQFAEHRRTHDLLGAWEVDTASVDQWRSIAQQVDTARTSIQYPWWGRASGLRRVAAAIVLGIVVGTASGFAARVSQPTGRGVEDIGDDAAMAAIGVDSLESPSATGLLLAFADSSSSPGMEGVTP